MSERYGNGISGDFSQLEDRLRLWKFLPLWNSILNSEILVDNNDLYAATVKRHLWPYWDYR